MSSWHDFVNELHRVDVTPVGTAIVRYHIPPKYADMGAYSESKFSAAKALNVKPDKVIVVNADLNTDETFLRINSVKFGVK